MRNALLVMSMLSGLTACGIGGNVERDFLCGAQTGQPCATLSEIDGSISGAGVTPIAENAVDTQNKSLSQEPLSIGKTGLSQRL